MTDNLVYTSSTPKPSHSLSPLLPVRVGAEFAGTMLVAFAIYAISSWGAIINSTSILLLAGAVTAAAYAVATFIFGRASGAHFNPAITFAGVLIGSTQWIDGILYIIAQVLGALAGAGVWYLLTPTTTNMKMNTWLAVTVNGYDTNSPAHTLLANSGISFGIKNSLVLELALTLVIIAAYFATTRDNGTLKRGHVAAVSIAYGFAGNLAYVIDGAGFNPARSTGIAIIGAMEKMSTNPLSQLWVYWAAPFVAAAVVALGFIIRNSVQANRAETEAAVAALRLEQEAHMNGEEDETSDASYDMNAADVAEDSNTDEQEVLPLITVETSESTADTLTMKESKED
ncbi:MIP/aquaporin family protein [Alloscardovia venturai]|uniref:MIP/aquaporin family protein n=1 Tax=Alloscardovia venturai TaxID=1769421 RepID=A0ABW2Y8P4_9BIFI